MLRFEGIELVLRLAGNSAIVGNLGPTSDELWHAGHRDRNFYTYGNMGLCSSIALGMALATDEQVISLDGDGSLLMNLGTIASIGRENPKNLTVVVWDNEQWGQTGHQASHTAMGTDLQQVADSCGIGEFRGGCGIRREFLFLGDRAMLTIGADRRKFVPWGLEGGGNARGAHAHVTGSDGTIRELPTKVSTTLNHGDVLSIETPGGGAWGPLKKRDPAAVETDLRDGYIT